MSERTHAERINSNTLIDEYFDSFMIRYHYIDNIEPKTDYSIFGLKLLTPILGAPLAMHDRIHSSGRLGYARAITEAGSLTVNGYMSDEAMRELADAGIPFVSGVKPFAEKAQIMDRIRASEEYGAAGICMDIDHIFDVDGKYCKWPLGNLGRQTVEDLKSYVASTKLPFILKGVISPEDAGKCAEIGVSAIIVSTHNNRFPCAVPPLVALPDIKAAVNGKCPVLVDGGIVSGVEAFKALALGADGVLVCRAFMQAFKDGPEAVTEKLSRMTAELAGCMANTGAATVSDISAASLVKKNW